ncbi:carbohydrate ABC transporter substrate-binding protein (CUT1 family) [Hydrogenispora ethanolica]|uniref:Carbohydrate ABC transporter substrate-binding protein (CUT1 family) n=1 Tax=Hydrogenispora ethanolica TaxID=1082276 RepID=A0A4R1SD66_HYDET|nr:sugar ABC transporter substrate-binding protein [Hydrogenispora ethanolica]TCL76552.1 carbohydrate ABC transporter substrate-binding protein (CUT1 family) [Hydrogenispora ethanolica]
MNFKHRSIWMFLVFMAASVMMSAGAGAAKKFDGVTLNVAMQDHNATKALVELLPGFEKATGIKVNIDQLPQSELAKKAEASFAAGADNYDVIMTLIVNVSRYARANWLAPLDSYIKKSPDANIKDFMPGFINVQKYNKKTYGLPFYGESSCLMYRKDLLSAAGVAVPQTMDELLAAAQKLTKGNTYGIVLKAGRGQASNGYLWPMFLRSYGGDYFDKKYRPIFNSKQGQKATQFFADLMKYSPPGSVNMGWNEVQVSMQQGQAAMTIDATNFAQVFEASDLSKVAGKIGYAPVPKGPAGRFPAIAVASLNITNFSKRKDAAWEFIKWATSAETQKAMAKSGSRSDVTRISVYKDPEYQRIYNWDNGNWYKVTQESMQMALPFYRPVNIPEWPSIGDAISIQVQSVFTKEKDVKKALNDAATEVQNALKEAGYYSR